MLRPRAETMPAVTEPPSPNGLPMAITQSPGADRVGIAETDRLQRLVALHLEHREVDLRILADDLGLEAGPVGEDHADVVGVADHVIVGDDDSRGIDDEARAERIGAALRRVPELFVSVAALPALAAGG